MSDAPLPVGEPRRLEVSADLRELAAVRAFVREGAVRLGARDEAVGDVVQAVDESVANAIIHGYRGEPGEIEVELSRDGAHLVVRLRDEAPAFDPTALPAPDLSLPLARRRAGGLGVFLARELTDQMLYRRTPAGNELTLIKECLDTHEED